MKVSKEFKAKLKEYVEENSFSKIVEKHSKEIEILVEQAVSEYIKSDEFKKTIKNQISYCFKEDFHNDGLEAYLPSSKVNKLHKLAAESVLIKI